MIKNTLFIISFIFTFSCQAFPSLDFIQKHKSAKKSGLIKVGTGVAFILPSFIPLDSTFLNIAQSFGGTAGSGLILAGVYQILIETFAEQNEKQNLHLNTPRFDNFAHTLARNEEFLAGAVFAAAGLALYNTGQTLQASDNSIALTAIGLALMGAIAVKQFNKDYLPQILASLNK